MLTKQNLMFSDAKSKPPNLPFVTTVQGSEIESVSQYKYQGIVIDESLSQYFFHPSFFPLKDTKYILSKHKANVHVWIFFILKPGALQTLQIEASPCFSDHN